MRTIVALCAILTSLVLPLSGCAKTKESLKTIIGHSCELGKSLLNLPLDVYQDTKENAETITTATSK